MNEIRCSSPTCIVQDGVKGRLFTPPKQAQGLAGSWCPQCIKLNGEVRFFTGQTANMIRNKYLEYHETNLPEEVKLILTQFTRELIQELGEEL